MGVGAMDPMAPMPNPPLDASIDLVRSVNIRLATGKERDKKVIFEHEPKLCPTCRVFGHSLKGCTMIDKSFEIDLKAPVAAAVTNDISHEVPNVQPKVMPNGDNVVQSPPVAPIPVPIIEIVIDLSMDIRVKKILWKVRFIHDTRTDLVDKEDEDDFTLVQKKKNANTLVTLQKKSRDWQYVYCRYNLIN
ncbi:Uncharacterized protein Fot_28245 [Forsythia ovata]|uniref:Zinc knuckle CX2CX4HX4C domain-containing protein n=1 Tax=Forsythia ovata TaxID=205694 RepID=A0ABD1TNG8_9LAMI